MVKRFYAALMVALGLFILGTPFVWAGPAGIRAAGASSALQPQQTAVTTTHALSGTTPFPQVLARVPVSGDSVLDFARDEPHGRLFASSRRETVVIDSAGLTVTARVPHGGELLVDAASRRLYVYPGVWAGAEGIEAGVQVYELDTLQHVGELPGATYVAVDAAHGRVFTGSVWTPYVVDDGVAPVQIYDAESLDETETLTVTGIPIYNPARDDLIVLHESATVFDPATLDPVAELLPELVDQPIPGCNGCDYPADATVFVDENLIALELQRVSTGARPGLSPAPRFFDATTLEPVANDDVPFLVQASCGSTAHLQVAIDGKFHRNIVYRRYIMVENLVVEDLAHEQLAVRDGTYALFINPTTRQAILDQGYVVDLATLDPVGRFPAFCWFGYDAESGRFYGRDGDDLLIMHERGGAPLAAQAAVANVTLSNMVTRIVPSPAFAEDETIFAFVVGQGVVRSTDGGDSWSRLRGGMPDSEGLSLDLAISPDYAQDATIFAGGSTDRYQGEGVLRSQDGGETWQPLWHGLDALRVRDVALAPDYGTSGEVAVLSDYNFLDPWQSGAALYTSANRGISWTRAMTASTVSALPTVDEAVGSINATRDLPVRLAEFGEGISVTVEVDVDGGATWALADLGQAENDFFKRIVVAPDYPADPAIYVMSRFGVWRTLDAGQSWSRWADPRLDGRDYMNELTAIALARGVDETSHWLLLGTAAGEIWVIEAATEYAESSLGQDATATAVDSEPIAPATQTTVTPTVTPTATSSVTPTVSLQPSPQPSPLSGDAPAGLYRPEGPLAIRWETDATLQHLIGWATQESADLVQLARQEFTGGLMVWRGDTQQIYVIYNDKRWQVFEDTFVEGEPEMDPTITPPSGYRQPVRGFGKVWRDHPAVREQIGWALVKEEGFGGFIHPFERGILLASGDRILALLEADAPADTVGASAAGIWR